STRELLHLPPFPTRLSSDLVRYAEMYTMIDFRILVLIACMMSFGVAMEKTGADLFLAQGIQSWFGGYGELAVLAGFFALTVILRSEEHTSELQSRENLVCRH